MVEQPQARPKASNAKIIIAFILDFLTAFVVFGYTVAKFTGETTTNGFSLNGGSALLAFALMIAYFVIGNRVGGTLWKRILKVPVR